MNTASAAGRAHTCSANTAACVPSRRGHVPQIGGDYVSVKLACLDGVDPAELVAAPVHYANGRDNKWWEPPAETRHL